MATKIKMMSAAGGERDAPQADRNRGAWQRMQLAVVLAMARRLQLGSLDLVLPDASRQRFVGSQPGPHAEMTVSSPKVALRYLLDGSVGFAEAFMAGEIDSPDLAGLLELLDLNQNAWGEGYYGSIPSRLLRRLQHRLNDNSKRRARRNILAHYDLGNEFFGAWLDSTMTYSSALFTGSSDDLESAQRAKFDNLCQMIDLGPDHELLEIGSGWGGFAMHAAKERGASVTSITISKAQHEMAARRVQEAGLGERVSIRLMDYRDLEGRFDRIASIEMFEAVGERYWPMFFAKLKACLAPDGLAGMQVITIADRHFDAYRRGADFIQRYVFPGGMLPSPSALDRGLAGAGLVRHANHTFGPDYARTLAIWTDSFLDAWDRLQSMNFDERFKRLWRYYLAYCEAGFRTGSTDVVQLAMRHA